MTSRSTAELQQTFPDDIPTAVLLRAEGYAAKVYFSGVSGRRLIALIDDDCYISWTLD